MIIRYSLIFFILLWFLCFVGYTQILQGLPLQFGNPDRSGLAGNSISNLFVFDSKLLVGSTEGLSITEDNGESWRNYTPREYGWKGGVIAIDVASDGTIWISTTADSITEIGQAIDIGTGLRYLTHGTTEWIFINQPKDLERDTLGGKEPMTTNISNLVYDIAIDDNQIWIASFGGGLRRSIDQGKNWKVFTTDELAFNPFDNLNHLAYSVIIENGNIWVGTAQGISLSNNEGETWNRFFIKSDQTPISGEISGNWCIALAHNPWDNSVWAATMATTSDQFNAVSMTKDGGKTWQTFLASELSRGLFARSIAFYDSAVYVATESGVYKSIDNGQSWFKFPPVKDTITGELLNFDIFSSVITSPVEPGIHRVWAGNIEGLASTDNSGYTWTIYRKFVSTTDRTEPAVYPYPNPFSPMRGQFVRFQYNVSTGGNVKIEIFNFAMERVISLDKQEIAPIDNSFDRSIIWNGRDNSGRLVDNGVYIFKAEIAGNVTWGKVVVIN